MKRNNKKALYESIMKNVAKQVKKTLNERYEDESEEFSMTVNNCEGVVISDPCYVLDDNVYNDIWGANKYADGVIGDNVGLVHGTAYGDGSYESGSGNVYGVDAGAIGIFDLKYCKDQFDDDDVLMFKLDPNKEHFIELNYDNGTFYFSIDNEPVDEIWTSDNDEDEDEYEEPYWDEDEDEYEDDEDEY